MTTDMVWKRILAAALLVTALALIFESIVPASAPVIAIGALVCGLATWAVPVLSLAINSYRDRVGPRPTSLASVGRVIFIVITAAFFSAIGLPLALVTLILAPGTHWAWLAFLTIAGFWVLGGVLLCLGGIRSRSP
jgi:hypothetical protein